ncbi:MAG: hypothetical protein E5V41_09575 [Mesorhizobium sp.]|nr:MAG: hypothetical protein E5V41_09575 [Mesorhizobium sp.]
MQDAEELARQMLRGGDLRELAADFLQVPLRIAEQPIKGAKRGKPGLRVRGQALWILARLHFGLRPWSVLFRHGIRPRDADLLR